MAELQLTLDHGKRHELIRMADLMAGHIDILEIGYPELITFGLDLVKEIHEAHPDLKICADAKVFHGGSGVTRRCFEAGATIVTVLAYAPDQVIQQMVRHACEYKGAIMCDLDGVRNLDRRTAEVDKLGVRYCHVSSGFLMEHEYDLMKPTHGSIFQVRPLERAAAVKRNLLKRRIRESYRLQKDLFGPGKDILFIYTPKEVLPFADIYAAVGEAGKALPSDNNA